MPGLARRQRRLGFSDDGDVPAFPITKARPGDAVPAGRMGYSLSAEKLLLHTIQPQEVFDELLSTGVFVSDPSRVEPLHADAYGWLYRQMASRLSANQAPGARGTVCGFPGRDSTDVPGAPLTGAALAFR